MGREVALVSLGGYGLGSNCCGIRVGSRNASSERYKEKTESTLLPPTRVGMLTHGNPRDSDKGSISEIVSRCWFRFHWVPISTPMTEAMGESLVYTSTVKRSDHTM